MHFHSFIHFIHSFFTYNILFLQR